MAYLLDTNVLSELRKRTPDPAVDAWYESAAAAQLYVSPLSIGELENGIARLRLRDPVRAGKLQQWLMGIVTGYSDRLAPVTVEVAREWGRMNVARTLPVIDSLLAATAKVYGWTLVTRNIKDVTDTGAAVLNPWDWR